MDKELNPGQLGDQTPENGQASGNVDIDPDWAIDEDGNLILGGIKLDPDGNTVSDNPAGGGTAEGDVDDREDITDKTRDGDKEDGTTPEGDAKPEVPAPITPDDVKKSDFDSLSRDQLPDELKPFYDSMRASVGRKWDSLAEMRKELEAVLAKAKEQQLPVQAVPPQGVPMPMTREQQAKILTEEIIRRSTQMLGIAPTDFDPLNPMHQSFQQIATLQLHHEYVEAEAQRVKQEEVRRRVEEDTRTFEGIMDEFRASEPNFEAIHKWFPEWMGNLPVRKYNAITEVFRKADFQGIRNTVNELRTAWYQKNKPPINPVKVEKSSSTAEPPSRKITSDEFGSMSSEEQEQFLIDGGYVG
jgi:hypothetical protein